MSDTGWYESHIPWYTAAAGGAAGGVAGSHIAPAKYKPMAAILGSVAGTGVGLHPGEAAGKALDKSRATKLGSALGSALAARVIELMPWDKLAYPTIKDLAKSKKRKLSVAPPLDSLKVAFSTSSFAGDPGGGPFKQHSMLPGFVTPEVAVPDEVLKGRAALTKKTASLLSSAALMPRKMQDAAINAGEAAFMSSQRHALQQAGGHVTDILKETPMGRAGVVPENAFAMMGNDPMAAQRALMGMWDQSVPLDKARGALISANAKKPMPPPAPASVRALRQKFNTGGVPKVAAALLKHAYAASAFSADNPTYDLPAMQLTQWNPPAPSTPDEVIRKKMQVKKAEATADGLGDFERDLLSQLRDRAASGVQLPVPQKFQRAERALESGINRIDPGKDLTIEDRIAAFLSKTGAATPAMEAAASRRRFALHASVHDGASRHQLYAPVGKGFGKALPGTAKPRLASVAQ